jgi:hypothetical protein
MIQLRDFVPKLLQTQCLVSVLTSFLLRADDDARRQVPQANRAFRFVDMLPSRSTGAEGLDLALTQQVFVQFRQNNHL